MRVRKCIFILFCSFLFNQWNFASEIVPVSFDTLFPQTWLKKVVDAAIQVWGELDMLIEKHQEIMPDDRSLIIDASIGRLVICTTYLDYIFRDKQAFNVEHIEYLSHIIEHIDQSCLKLTQLIQDEHVTTFKYVLGVLRQKIQVLLFC